MKRKSKYKLIFTMKLAGYLMQQGFVLQDMRKDLYGSNRKVFVFKNSDALMKQIEEYSKIQ